jgi:hypothetical protein
VRFRLRIRIDRQTTRYSLSILYPSLLLDPRNLFCLKILHLHLQRKDTSHRLGRPLPPPPHPLSLSPPLSLTLSLSASLPALRPAGIPPDGQDLVGDVALTEQLTPPPPSSSPHCMPKEVKQGLVIRLRLRPAADSQFCLLTKPTSNLDF